MKKIHLSLLKRDVFTAGEMRNHVQKNRNHIFKKQRPCVISSECSDPAFEALAGLSSTPMTLSFLILSGGILAKLLPHAAQVATHGSN
jgi:hypothetical protein